MENMADKSDSKTNLIDKQCVFYCGECRDIFGDSSSTVRMNKDLQSISLQFVTDAVMLTEECETSVNGSDIGSTFNILKCKSCQKGIGRYYLTTPRSLDLMRNVYTLELNKIKSYQLGRYTNDSNKNLVDDFPSLEKLGEMILKTQSMVYALHERVENLESYLEEVDSSEDNIEQNTKSHQKKRKIT